MAKKATTKRRTTKKASAKAAPSPSANGSSQEITPEQLVNAVGSVFAYLENTGPKNGSLQAVDAHGNALRTLFVIQQAMIQTYGLNQEQLQQQDPNGAVPTSTNEEVAAGIGVSMTS